MLSALTIATATASAAFAASAAAAGSDRLGIIESREYEDSLTEAQKKDLIDHHNWFQSLTENEKLTLNYDDEKQK